MKKSQLKVGMILEERTRDAQDSGAPYLLVTRIYDDGFVALRSENKHRFFVDSFMAGFNREQNVRWRVLRYCQKIR